MKICDYKNPSNISIPHIIELSDDFSINGHVYNRYTLKCDDELDFFILDANISNDYRYMPIDNLSSVHNDYPLHKVLKDNNDSNIIYVLYTINAKDWITKIQFNQEKNIYEEICKIQVTNLDNLVASNISYYARKHFEFIGQTDQYILLYDNFCIRNIKKDLSNIRIYNLKEPILVQKIENNLMYCIDVNYSQCLIYNIENNTIFKDWENISLLDTDYYFGFDELNGTKYPIINNAFFIKGFIYYNSFYSDENNTQDQVSSINMPQADGYNIRVKQNASFSNITDVLIGSIGSLASYSEIWFRCRNTDSYIRTYIERIGHTYAYEYTLTGRVYIHKINTSFIDIITKNNYHRISSSNDADFNNIYIDKYINNTLLLIYNSNNQYHSVFILQNINLDILIQKEYEFIFEICDKYNDKTICIIDTNLNFYIFKIDILNNQINQVYVKNNIQAFSIQNDKSIWLFNNSNFDVLTLSTPIDLNGAFEQETYNYQNQDINSYVTIYAKNFLQEFIKTKIKITLSGPCKFNNNTKTYIGYTDIQEIQIPVIITGAGKCTCNIEEL